MRAARVGGAAARLFLLLAIAFGVCAGIVPTPTRPPAPHFASQLERDAFTATELHADAMESLRSGVPVSGTLWRFERAVRLSPLNASLWADLGVAHLRLGNWAKAEDCLRAALELEPAHGRAAEAREELRLYLGRLPSPLVDDDDPETAPGGVYASADSTAVGDRWYSRTLLGRSSIDLDTGGQPPSPAAGRGGTPRHHRRGPRPPPGTEIRPLPTLPVADAARSSASQLSASSGPLLLTGLASTPSWRRGEAHEKGLRFWRLWSASHLRAHYGHVRAYGELMVPRRRADGEEEVGVEARSDTLGALYHAFGELERQAGGSGGGGGGGGRDAAAAAMAGGEPWSPVAQQQPPPPSSPSSSSRATALPSLRLSAPLPFDAWTQLRGEMGHLPSVVGAGPQDEADTLLRCLSAVLLGPEPYLGAPPDDPAVRIREIDPATGFPRAAFPVLNEFVLATGWRGVALATGGTRWAPLPFPYGAGEDEEEDEEGEGGSGPSFLSPSARVFARAIRRNPHLFSAWVVVGRGNASTVTVCEEGEGGKGTAQRCFRGQAAPGDVLSLPGRLVFGGADDGGGNDDDGERLSRRRREALGADLLHLGGGGGGRASVGVDAAGGTTHDCARPLPLPAAWVTFGPDANPQSPRDPPLLLLSGLALTAQPQLQPQQAAQAAFAVLAEACKEGKRRTLERQHAVEKRRRAAVAAWQRDVMRGGGGGGATMPPRLPPSLSAVEDLRPPSDMLCNALDAAAAAPTC
jgi:hypothetical protein